jgi:FeS assembly SUF system protein
MTDRPAQPVTRTPTTTKATRLTVLPSSGKVDQLRRDIMSDRDSQGASPSHAQPADPAPPVSPPPPAVAADAPPAGEPVPAAHSDSIARKLLEGQVIEAIRSIYDPEIPVNIYDLGLIYDIQVDETNAVKVRMTLTAPACPVAGTLPGEVEKKIESIPEVRTADVELVWEPPWDRSRMSEAAMLTLGMF